MEHCLDRGYCMKAQGLPCAAEGLHGESNAIISAARMGIAIEGSIIYSIYSPCLTCCNMIASAGIVRVVYAELYENYQEGPATLKKLGVEVEHISL